MRFATLAAVVAATAGLAASQPSLHRHSHQRYHEKRVAVADAAADMVTVYELNGHAISAEEVQQGIANGTLVFEDGAPAPAPAAAVAAPVAALAPVAAPASGALTLSMGGAVTGQAASSPAKAQGGLSGSLSGGHGLDKDFPDGTIDCTDFPDQYGAVKVDYLGLGGWTGVQAGSFSLGGLLSNIETVVTGSCPNGACCKEGAFCSYACPAGYQKAQWPATQGATGQSVGGLQCKGGKLYLTNKSMSSKLCMTGNTVVDITVKNTMGEKAAICRTDYPGTEAETVPLAAHPGSSQKLTCPDADNYYKWEGKQTSAQYYVNPKGVGIEDGCRWGDAGSSKGNYAPLNLGVGYSAGTAWLAIFQNAPTTNDKLDYTVELVGDNGGFDNLSGRCRYQNGQYCSGDNYENCNTNGCTVGVTKGSATFVLSD